MKSWLETITNVATIATCLVIVALLLHGPFQRAPDQAQIVKGERIDTLSGVSFGAAERTLVLAMRKDCHFCEESIPFYKSLVQASAKQQGRAVQFVVVTTDDDETAAHYLRERDLSVEQIVSLSPGKMSTLKVPGTPTLILTDRTGLVEAVWIGKLTGDQEADVMATLGLPG
jgi:hypothetical protein